MPPSKFKGNKRSKKHQGSPASKNSLANFFDAPSGRTRSASGKIQQSKMASTTMQAGQSTVSNTNEENSPVNITFDAVAKEGFVAGMVEQINNSPANSPAGSPNRKNTAKMPTHEHDTANIINHENPSDLQQVFRELNSTMKGIQKQLAETSRVQAEHTFRVSTLEFVQKDEVQSMRQVLARMEKQEKTIEMLVNHAVKQDQLIQDLFTKQNDSQARSMRRNIIISGVKEEGFTEDCEQLATDFFEQQLGIQKSIDIKIAHRIGTGLNRPLVVKLRDVDDKPLIFQHTQKLKGTSYYVGEQLPEELAERKRHIQRIKGQNKKLPSEQQLSLSAKRDRLLINNEMYKTPLQPPSALRWLSMEEAQQRDINHTRIYKGPTDYRSHSSFVSYAAETSSLEEVQRAYDKVFLREPRATHIVCAYIIPGAFFPKTQNGADDREFGAHRQILRKMQEAKVQNRAVFVARYYGGVHLGSDRFRIYKDLAMGALEKVPIKHPEAAGEAASVSTLSQVSVSTPTPTFSVPAGPTTATATSLQQPRLNMAELLGQKDKPQYVYPPPRIPPQIPVVTKEPSTAIGTKLRAIAEEDTETSDQQWQTEDESDSEEIDKQFTQMSGLDKDTTQKTTLVAS